ncbi:MAG: GDP-L-fucose synthase [Alphaproteobacteria bacterium]|nr:GDP-L-fucose synthase [Alphaproteobacteria bacterium]
MNINDKIYVAGHNGMVGSALVRKLTNEGYKNIITANSASLDLKNQTDTDAFISKNKPDYIFIAAAKVGGIIANSTYKAEFIYNNMMIAANIINAAYENGVTKLMYLGSSCIYPKMAPQPIKEEYLLTGYLEPTNKPYAVAKIAGIELCQSYRDTYNCNFICVMPTNLYGPNDNYHPQNSHVLPALIRKFVSAKKNLEPKVTVWGTGNARREFLHVDDLAEACFFLMQNYNERDIINIGCGIDISIKELAETIKGLTDYTGDIIFDHTKPDGTPRKLLDVNKINALGWTSKIPFQVGLDMTIREFTEKHLPHLS